MITNYPDDTVLFPMTLEDLSLMALMNGDGNGPWSIMKLRAQVLLAEQQAKIAARKLK